MSRLIRYKGFIEHQTKRGYAAGCDWFQSDNDALMYRGKELLYDYDSDFTHEQVVSICQTFAQEIYCYVNLDNMMVGNAAGMRTGNELDEEGARFSEALPAGFRAFQMDFCLDTLFNQIQELEDRYYNLKRPLGPDCVLSPGSTKGVPPTNSGKKGKNNRGLQKEQPG
jgi:hypothetical protein